MKNFLNKSSFIGTILLITFPFITCCNMNGQPSESDDPENGYLLAEGLHQQWDGSEWVNNYKETIIYDRNDNMIEKSWQGWKDSKWVKEINDVRIITYTYDENNNMIEEAEQHWKDSKWIKGYKQTFTYDENDNLIEKIRFHSRPSGLQKTERYSDTYDENNNLIEQLGQRWDLDELKWVYQQKATLIYDANNKSVGSLFQSRSSYREKSSSTYDESGNLIEMMRYYGDESDWMDSGSRTYTYDANNNWIQYNSESYNPPAEGLDGYWSYWKGSRIFDANNNLIEKISQNRRDSGYEQKNKQTYSYDKNSNLIEEINEIWEKDSWVGWDKQTFIFDKNNNLIDSLAQSWDGSVWVNKDRRKYQYDEYNNKIQELIQKGDGNNWLNINRTKFKYIKKAVKPITGAPEL